MDTMGKRYGMLLCHLVVIISVLVLLQPTGYAKAGTPEVYLPTGFPQVVVVSGTNYDMGVQYGEQTAHAIVHNLAIFKSKLYKAVTGGENTVSEDMKAWNVYLKRYDPTLADWLNGISQGCKNRGYSVSYSDLVLLMVYPTELWARPTNPYPPEMKTTAQKVSLLDRTNPLRPFHHSCNSFAATGAATPDGKPIHAITQMADTEMMDNVILLAFPKSGYSFVSQTYAGRVNANSAMNSKGFAWSMTAILSNKPVWGLTEVYFHYLAQLVSSRADAVKYLQETPRGGVAGGFILSDPTGIEAFETNANVFSRRSPSAGKDFVVQTNHLVDPKLKAYNPPWLVHLATYARYDTVFEYLTEAAPGSVNFDFTKKLFASDDWYEKGAKTWHRNDPGAPNLSNDHTSINESIFHPSDLVAYLATGTPSGNGIPAYATGEYVKIKLSTDPVKVTDQADSYALSDYWKAADLFEKEMNKSPTSSYLTIPMISEIKRLLDKAMNAYSTGIDRAAYAYLTKNVQKSNALWGSALTGFAKAQLYAQEAVTILGRAGGGNN
jgi:hypothetical protein